MSTTSVEALVQVEQWGDLLESATHEVFGMMLGCDLEPTSPPETCVAEVTAVVGVAGPLSGAVTVRCSRNAAERMAAAMLGIPVTEVNQQHWDAVGEICNMVAGSFKAKLADIGDRCMLSVPTVVNGSDYTVRSLVNGNTIHRAFKFGGDVISESVEMYVRSEA